MLTQAKALLTGLPSTFSVAVLLTDRKIAVKTEPCQTEKNINTQGLLYTNDHITGK